MQVLATSKLASISGTLVSAGTYVRRIGIDRATAIPLAAGALAGSAAGAAVAGFIPRPAFTPLILAALIIAGAFTLSRPDPGRRGVRAGFRAGRVRARRGSLQRADRSGRVA